MAEANLYLPYAASIPKGVRLGQYVVDTGETVRMGRLVKFTGTNEVSECAGADLPLGYSLPDAENSVINEAEQYEEGQVVRIAAVGAGEPVSCVASGTVTQGEEVETDAGGTVKTLDTGTACGKALTTADDTERVVIILY